MDVHFKWYTVSAAQDGYKILVDAELFYPVPITAPFARKKNHLNLATNDQLQFSYYHYGLNLDHCKIKNNVYGIIEMSNHSTLLSFLVLHNYHVPVV